MEDRHSCLSLGPEVTSRTTAPRERVPTVETRPAWWGRHSCLSRAAERPLVLQRSDATRSGMASAGAGRMASAYAWRRARRRTGDRSAARDRQECLPHERTRVRTFGTPSRRADVRRCPLAPSNRQECLSSDDLVSSRRKGKACAEIGAVYMVGPGRAEGREGGPPVDQGGRRRRRRGVGAVAGGEPRSVAAVAVGCPLGHRVAPLCRGVLKDTLPDCPSSQYDATDHGTGPTTTANGFAPGFSTRQRPA